MEGEIWSDLVQNLTLKRKRSQRQRLLGNSSSSSEDDAGEGKHVAMTTTAISSSSEELMMEELQAAKCLMLLARDDFNFHPNEEKKKKMMMSVGLYECKTCNRTFPSFQALGGHRTSHKKMKIKTEQQLPLQKPQVPKPVENGIHIVPPIALQLGTSSRTLAAAARGRVHECLICGANFASGQALGGHMRRHRVTVAVNSPSETTPGAALHHKSDGITQSLLSHVPDEETGNETSTSNNEFQCLDLNLPASSEEKIDMDESQFSFGSKQQKQLQDSGIQLRRIFVNSEANAGPIRPAFTRVME